MIEQIEILSEIEDIKSYDSYCRDLLNDIASGNFEIDNRFSALLWFRRAVRFNNMNALNVILDFFEVPKEGMSLKERLSYYYLLES